MVIKKFRDLEPGDPIYFIDPQNQTIKNSTILKSRIHPLSVNLKVWYLEFDKPVKVDGIDNEKMKIAREQGVKNTSIKTLVPKDAYMATLITQLPTVICTDKEKLRLWMEKDKEAVKEIITQAKKMRNL